MLQATVFKVVGHAFDGDSCFNSLQNRFQKVWKPVGCAPVGFDQFVVSSPSFLLVATDPLHFLKCIRCRFFSGKFQIAPGGSTYIFAITKMHAVAQLPAVVFNNSRIAKCMIHPHFTSSLVTWFSLYSQHNGDLSYLYCFHGFS
jgi:hypothetical protein